MPQGAFSSVLDSAMVCLMRIIKQTKYEAISQEQMNVMLETWFLKLTKAVFIWWKIE